jgi:opacity protein-like surface antigen
MKRIIGLLTLAAMLVTPSLAFASGQGNVYVAPKLIWGITQMQGIQGSDGGDKWNKTGNAFGGALAVGYNFAPIRAELEFAAFTEADGKIDSDKFKVQANTLFVNAYYDFATGTQFTPYVGAGLGLAFLNSKWRSSDDDSLGSKMRTNFAWNVGAGVAYEIVQNVSLDLGYRFAGLGQGRTKSDGDGYIKAKNVYQHQIMLGLRFAF